MSDRLCAVARRTLFVVALLLAGLAVAEWAANLGGWTLGPLQGLPPYRLAEYAAVALLFVVALELRDIRRHAALGGPRA